MMVPPGCRNHVADLKMSLLSAVNKLAGEHPHADFEAIKVVEENDNKRSVTTRATFKIKNLVVLLDNLPKIDTQ